MDTLFGKSEHWFFRRYARLWAKDINAAANTDQDFLNLWDRLLELESFTSKLENPKAMLWFSINGTCEDHFPEFWPLKMILIYNHKGPQEFDGDEQDAEVTISCM